jgi:hypothetical protein
MSSCLTAHWVESGRMHHAVLTFEVFCGSTTGVELGKHFQRVFDEYNFDLKFVVAIITDTTCNMNTFWEYLQQRGVAHLYCVDHVLHLNAKHAYNDANLPDSGNAIKAARSFVGVFYKIKSRTCQASTSTKGESKLPRGAPSKDATG